MAIRVAVLFSILLLAGCASDTTSSVRCSVAFFVYTSCPNPMIVEPLQELPTPSREESQVVFMHPEIPSGLSSASLYEVIQGEINFIGILFNDTKLSYTTTPGKHVFMVVSEVAEFMEANLDPGKSYFSIVFPWEGTLIHRFTITPVKANPPAQYHLGMRFFQRWVRVTKLVTNSEKSIAWYEDNKDRAKRAYDHYWPVWQNKTADDLAIRSLAPEDGTVSRIMCEEWLVPLRQVTCF